MIATLGAIVAPNVARTAAGVATRCPTQLQSRRHALVSRRGDACRIRDLGSTNGTIVNGVPVTVADLRGGDEIRLGEILLCVR